MNTIGNKYRLTSFGESHGKAVGGIIDGCPANFKLDILKIQSELDRRKPGQNKYASQRKEVDKIEILSGVFEGKTTGTPIAFMINNKDANSKDYNELKDLFRPSHADYTYLKKYGFRDYRGGGRASARATIAVVVAGAIAKQILEKKNIKITAYTNQIGKIAMPSKYENYTNEEIESSILRCPDEEIANEMQNEIKLAMKNKDTLGGIVSCKIENLPAGIGEPIFAKLTSALSHSIMSINASKGIEFGNGFDAASLYGSANNDEMFFKGDSVHTKTNNSGGIIGGISNGEDILFRVAFKPVATIFKEQNTINKNNENVKFTAKGRHDPCVVPRAVPIVEATTAIVILDMIQLNK